MAEGLQLQNIGRALQGFSAGLQGNLPQMVRNDQNQQVLDMNREKLAQEVDLARKKSMYQAADAALKLARQGQYEQVANLGIQRLQALQSFPDANPEDTQRLTQLAIAAKNGEEEAAELLEKELESVVQVGQAYGILETPKRDTKVVGDSLVDTQSGEVVFEEGADEYSNIEKLENGVVIGIKDGMVKAIPMTEEATQAMVRSNEIKKTEEELENQKTRFSQASTIRGQIDKANSDFQTIANSWDRVAASAQEPSAAGDLSLIFNFMKMLDPGSVVREREFATAQNAAGVPDRVANLYNRALTGERLNSTQRKDFLNQAKNIFEASKKRADIITDEYVRLAETYDIPKEEVVISRGDSPTIEFSEDQDGGFVIETPNGKFRVTED